jgi:antitoxin component YwqK of YwqJK toxin-antitoxin module
MRYRICLLCFVLSCTTITSYSQTKKYLYYLDKDLNSTSKEKSVFSATGVYENGLLELRLYNSSNKSLVYIEHYTDSSLQLSDGFFQSYYPNASKEWEGNYSQGKEDGLWQKWDSLGHMIDSSLYNSGEKITEVHYGYYKNGVLDSFIVNNTKTDQLQKTFYNDKGNVVSEVSFTGQNGFEKVYNNGIMIRSDSVFTREEIEASFPGGDNAWNRYIVAQIQNNQDQFGKNDYGTCLVKFIIDIDGKVSNVAAVNMKDTNLAEIAIRAIRYGPKWKVAMQYGRPVKAYRIQPVTLSKPN